MKFELIDRYEHRATFHCEKRCHDCKGACALVWNTKTIEHEKWCVGCWDAYNQADTTTVEATGAVAFVVNRRE